MTFATNGLKWRWLCWLWAFVWQYWLWNDQHQKYDKVLAVLGWRTARVKSVAGYIKCMSPCFWWFK